MMTWTDGAILTGMGLLIGCGVWICEWLAARYREWKERNG